MGCRLFVSASQFRVWWVKSLNLTKMVSVCNFCSFSADIQFEERIFKIYLKFNKKAVWKNQNLFFNVFSCLRRLVRVFHWFMSDTSHHKWKGYYYFLKLQTKISLYICSGWGTVKKTQLAKDFVLIKNGILSKAFTDAPWDPCGPT